MTEIEDPNSDLFHVLPLDQGDGEKWQELLGHDYGDGEYEENTSAEILAGLEKRPV